MSKRRWLRAILKAADDETIALPWTRSAGRAKRKAGARARARAA